MFVEGIDEGPILKKFSFTHSINIKWYNNSQLKQCCLSVFEVISILVFIFGRPCNFGMRWIPIEMIQQSAVHNTIPKVFDFRANRHIWKQGFQPARYNCFRRHKAWSARLSCQVLLHLILTNEQLIQYNFQFHPQCNPLSVSNWFLYLKQTHFVGIDSYGLCFCRVINKMLRNSQQIVTHAAEKIIGNVQQNISSIEKANANKPAFSAIKIFNVLGQITDQVSYAPDQNGRLKTPKDLSSLRLDSYMSVFNVQTPVRAPRHRSLTKNYRKRKSTMEQQDILQGFRKKRRTTYNKIQLLAEQNNNEKPNSKDIQIYQRECQEEDNFRAAFEKKIAEVIQQKRKTKPKFLSALELKQRFSYDYECKRIKIKNQAKNNLVSSNKSLTAELSKDIVKKSLPHKLDKPQSKTLQTQKVVEKSKKSKKSVKQVAQQTEPEVQVQFSNIRTLMQNVQCVPGVRFSFEGQLLKSKRVRTDISQSFDQSRRSEKLISRKRSQDNSNKLLHYTPRSIRNQSLENTSKQMSQSDLRNFTNSSLKNSKQAKISIQNQQMRKYLLAPQNTDNQNTQKSERKLQIQIQEHKNLNLDTNDIFNIKYIRGIKNTANQTSTTLSNRQAAVLPKSKGNFLKVREKLQNKMAFISQMKKKFQLGLRDSNINKNTPQSPQ